MIYSVVTQVQQKANTRQACRALQVSRAGYYAARRRSKQPTLCAVSVQVKAAFETNQRCYGSRRIVDELTAQGIAIGRYKVRRLMREAGLKPVWKRKFVNTTDSKHDLPVAQNLLNRQFNPPQPNQAWTSDITYLRSKTGWLYLAAVMDLHSRKIIGWAMSPAMPAELVCQALRMAIGQRQPTAGLILHSDRGSHNQWLAVAFGRQLSQMVSCFINTQAMNTKLYLRNTASFAACPKGRQSTMRQAACGVVTAASVTAGTMP